MSENAPTPPPAAPQSGTGFAFDPARLNIFDRIAVGAGLLFLIFSFFGGFIHASVKGFNGVGGGADTGGSAWHSWGSLAVLLVLVATVLVAAKGVAGLVPPTVPVPLIAAGAAVLGWVLLLLRAFTGGGYPDADGFVSYSPGWSAWALFIIGLVVVAATVIPLTSAAGSVERQLNDRLTRS